MASSVRRAIRYLYAIAPLPVIPLTYRVALNWVSNQPGIVATNVMHIFAVGSNAALVRAAVNTNVTAAMWSCQTVDAQVDNVVTTPLDGVGNSDVFQTGKPAKWTGVQAHADWIPQQANIIKLTTAKRGRSYRGRLFLPFIAEGQQSNGIITPATVTATTAAWVAFNAALVGSAMNMCVASYALASSEIVTAIRCEGYTATQRRRNKRTSA